jgi:hypothetical protein
VYLAGVAAVVLWPAPVDRPAAGGLAGIFIWLHVHGLPRWLGYAQFEWFANVPFFVPFGVFAVLLGFRAWLGVLAGFAASCAAEAAQFLFLPERTASAADVAANTVGTVAGVLGTLVVLRRRRRGSGAPAVPGAGPPPGASGRSGGTPEQP